MNSNIILSKLRKLNTLAHQNPSAPMVQLIGCDFSLSYENPIIDLPNRPAPRKYIARELAWYLSQSLNIHPMVDSVTTWNNVAGSDGSINSNYGWCVFSEANGLQFHNALQSLILNKDSRQAIMLYNRPSMHTDSVSNGKHEFMCTLATHFIIENDKLEVIHTMRSNDAIYGFVSDFAWVSTLSNLMYNTLKMFYPTLKRGKLHWHADTFHVYNNKFSLLDSICNATER